MDVVFLKGDSIRQHDLVRSTSIGNLKIEKDVCEAVLDTSGLGNLFCSAK